MIISEGWHDSLKEWVKLEMVMLSRLHLNDSVNKVLHVAQCNSGTHLISFKFMCGVFTSQTTLILDVLLTI